jgi:hypothetical protein
MSDSFTLADRVSKSCDAIQTSLQASERDAAGWKALLEAKKACHEAEGTVRITGAETNLARISSQFIEIYHGLCMAEDGSHQHRELHAWNGKMVTSPP